MTGPVTLTCTVGNSETAPIKGFVVGSATLDPVLSATNTVTINRSGPGAVTINAGVGTSAGPTATPDGMLYLNGADFVTIDGLTFTDSNSASATVAMEFGIALFKRVAGDGCNNNTIQNCIFNMQRINNTAGVTPMLDGSWAIEILNSTAAAATTSLTPTNGGTLATNGTNSANKFYSNAINGGNGGIGFGGFAASTGVGPAPVATTFLGDLSNDVGGASAATGNTILNFGGGAATNPAAGIRLNNEWSANVSNNIINNNDGGGVNHATTLRGIYGQAGTSANVTISNNTITLKGGGTTSAVTGIENVIGSTVLSNTVTITGNILQNFTNTTGTTATMTGILAAASATNQNVNSNQVINNTIGLSGTASSCIFQGIYASASSTTFTANSNTVSGNVLANQFGTLYSIRASTSTLNYDSNTISNNTIPNSAGATSSSIYGFYNASSPVIENYTNNNINNLTITGSSTATGHIIYGIYMLTASGAKTISGNNINNLTFTSSGAGYSSVVGIRDQYASTGNIFKNVVHSLSSTGITPTVNGIRFGESLGTTYNVYNNIVGNLTAPASTGFNLVGIYGGSAAATHNVSFNTVYLNATSSASGSASSAYFMSSTTPTTNLIDNIFINLSTGTTSWLSTALRRTSTVLTSYGTTSNNNFVYCGTPSATNAIYYDLTNTDQTLAAFKARVTPRETASISEAVSTTPGVFFQSFTGPATGTSTTFLHLVNGLSTQIESGGITVSGITDDYDGDTRNATTPDVGADEFTGVAVDLSPPAISYTPLGSSLVTATRSFTPVTVTDATGVNTTAGTRPRVYYKKTSDVNNTFNDNTSGTVGWKFAEATGAGGSPFSFTIDYSLLFGGGGVTAGDTIQYFVVAQDTVTPTPNVGINSGVFNATPTSVALTAAAFPITGSINSYAILASISGSFNVGAGQTYLTLTAAVADLNSKVLTGPVTFILKDASNQTSPFAVDNTGEIFPITINANGGSSATNTVTIKPDVGLTATLTTGTNTTASAALILNGADWIIIDGSNSVGGTTRDLTITNTNTSLGVGAMVWLQTTAGLDAATNNTVKNVNLVGNSNTTTLFGVGSGSATISTTSLGTGNNNNTIQNNNISKTQYGIYSQGASAASKNTGNIITGNLINTASPNNVAFGGIWVGFENSIVISGNTVDGITNTTSPDVFGITLGFGTSMSATTSTGNEVTNATVSKNVVGSVTNSGTFSAYGIGLSAATSRHEHNLEQHGLRRSRERNLRRLCRRYRARRRSRVNDQRVF